MTVGIVTNKEKDPALSYTAQVHNFLVGQGVTVAEDFCTNADFWIVLGGDGTMLRCSHLAAIHGIPLLGINLGTLGLLTDADKHDGLEVLVKVLAGEYKTEKRMMLDAASHIALNDVCVGATGRVKMFSVYVNDHLLDTIRADGIIVATPTGSTAYSLSAGGPLLMPEGQMMVVTPLCAHSLSTRPLVIGAEEIVRIVPHQVSPIIIDGETIGETRPDEGVVVRKSVYSAAIIKTTHASIYDVLRKKRIL